jgi:hypothetical protein
MTARIQNATSQPDITPAVQHLFKEVYAAGGGLAGGQGK